MISVLQPTGAAARIDSGFVVRYNGRALGFYLARILPLLAVFALLAFVYLDDDSRRWIFGRASGNSKPFSWLEFGFLLALVTAALLDFVLTLRRVRRGAMALSISPDGITGAVRHKSRRLAWNEIADVHVEGRFLVVRRLPQSLFQELLAHRGLSDINIPAHQLDRDADDILAAVRHFAPVAYRRAAAN